MPTTARPRTAVLAFQFLGCAYQPPAGDQTWAGQLHVVARPAAALRHAARPARLCLSATSTLRNTRQISTNGAAAAAEPYDDGTDHARFPPLEQLPPSVAGYPSPLPERALKSAKLAALHARLSLPAKLPLQTLARTLVDASADEHPNFNNSNLAFVGHTLINYHMAEYLMCRFPRLPMTVMYAAMEAYAGKKSLFNVARSWGVDAAAAPGGEVDPGLLQFVFDKPGVAMVRFGYKRTEEAYLEKYKWRRGISSRIMYDDDFGDLITKSEGIDTEAGSESDHMSYGNINTEAIAERAHANHVRAVVGAVYVHCGREAVQSFIKAHILSRTLNFESLFKFKNPIRELALLCAREEFEHPVARLLSETGRASRTPVYVVGIYSGSDKLGEGAGSSLVTARYKAVMNTLKAWYLYSPKEHVRVPSDMLIEGAKPWEPVYVDIGEIIAN
ncbi:ribonuclease III domain-containing protein [Bombardia bombarda]|uniref:Large ribosomal subunit protein mL44 n=1 Tax=Bombardia bombarda TaxID=252184 RepID=A0AA39XNI5_9PEZI|nr:ribonuclease III domain-containing protein [Bombardia bombarda]